MRVFVAGKLVQRSWQDNDGNKRQTVEIQVTHVGPDLQFATAEVVKSSAGSSRRSLATYRFRSLFPPFRRAGSWGTFGAGRLVSYQ
jgi:single-strand DNA-binding protein